MCEKCGEIEAKVENYQRLAKGVTDPQTIDGLQHIVNELEREKAALHPPEQS